MRVIPTRSLVSMRPSPPKRIRAVRLNPESLKSLTSALQERWLKEAGKGRLTREMKAELMGVSAVTAQRILQNKGVDRATLALVFRNLGLDWQDSVCEPARTPDFSCIPLAREVVSNDIAAKPLPPTWGPWARLAGAVALLTPFVFGAMALMRPQVDSRFPEPMLLRSAALVSSGTEKYHSGDLLGARPELIEAVKINRRYRGPSELSESLKILGDVESGLGNLEAARDLYQEVLHLRKLFAEDKRNGSVLEALGVLKTRLGDLEGAKRDLERSIELFRANEDWPGVPMALRDLGTVAFLSGALTEADSRFQEALSHLGGVDKPDIVTDIRARQALVALKRGQAAKARSELMACLAYWQDREHPRWIAATQLQLGLAELRAGNEARARELFTRSQRGFETVNDRAGAMEAADRLAALKGSSRSVGLME